MGWTAILADTETRLEPNGAASFAAARAEALAHLRGRIANLKDAPATRRAGLQLTLRRIETATPARCGGADDLC